MATKSKIIRIVLPFLVLVIIIMAIIFLSSRLRVDLFEGKTGYSGSIAESKRLNVFVSEYNLLDDSISLGSEHFIPGEIWTEKVWSQGSHEKPLIVGEQNEYSNYWLYIEIPQSELVKSKKYFDPTNNHLAFETNEGKTFWQRKCGAKNFFVASFKELPGERIELKLIARPDTTDKAVIPTKWKNPILIDEITLVEDK